MISDEVRAMCPVTPKITAPRDIQVEVMEKILAGIAKGKTKFTICAPVGIGKSLIGLWAGITCLDIHEHSVTKGEDKVPAAMVYTSPLNVLVDQMHEGFNPRQYTARYGGVVTLKGREHYPCPAGKANASVGFCKLNRCTLTGERGRHCKECDKKHKCICMTKCVYKAVKKAYHMSQLGNTNLSMFLILGKGEDAEHRPVVVVDECDSAEGFIRMQYSTTVDQYIHFGNTCAPQHQYFLQHVQQLRTLLEIMEYDVESMESGSVLASDREIISKLRTIEKIQTLLYDVTTHKKTWVVFHDTPDSTRYEPITVDRFIAPLLDSNYVFMMSATPKRQEGYEFIEVPSTFPVENRPWAFYPIGKMGLDYRDATSKLLADFLLGLHGKTLVHCHSYPIAKTLREDIQHINNRRVVLLQHKGKTTDKSEADSYGRDKIVSAFKQHPDQNAILLSVNLARGVDFPEPEICNNVIIKMPWFNHTDPLVQAKNFEYGNTNWQHEEIANVLMQAYGRLTRSPEKKSRCIITDVDFNDPKGYGPLRNWYQKKKGMFYSFFTEAEVSVLESNESN